MPTHPKSNLLDVIDLTKHYTGTPAVQNLTFQAKAGSIIGLVGPNGAGKTTTLRMLAGIIKPTSGQITIDGLDIDKDALAAKQITGYVPDEPHLFESLTVWEHIEFTASVYRLHGFQKDAAALLDRFQMTSRRDTPVQDLSLGMRQKVAICCVYLTQPRLLMLDEPLTGLDPMGIREISQSITRFASSGSTIIISSHLLGLVEDLCTDILLLRDGQCLLGGPLDVVLNRLNAVAGTQAESLETVFFRTLGAQDDAGP